MSWSESSVQTRCLREAEWRNQSSPPQSPGHKAFLWLGKEEREMVSEGRSIAPGVERPVTIFQKELLRKIQTPEKECEHTVLRQGAGNSTG